MRTVRLSTVALLGALVMACDGQLGPGAAAPSSETDAGGTLDAPPGADDLLSAAEDANVEDAPGPDVGSPPDRWLDLASASLPEGVAPPKLLVGGQARLVGDGLSACSHQVPASANGDRWCAFRRPAAGGKGTELWVIDVTKAASQTTPCDGTRVDCLRLTSTLWTEVPTGGPTQANATRFDGDTLFFHADATSVAADPYLGPIYAWRPGWSSGRAIVINAYSCFGNERAAVASCAANLRYDGGSVVDFELFAGPIADPAGGPVPRLDRARLRLANGDPAYQTNFSPNGDYLVYSTAATPESMTAGLRVARIVPDGASTPVEIQPDVVDWDISEDGSRVYFLKEFKDAVGHLMVADFPSGANAQQLAAKTGRYVVLGRQPKGDYAVGYFLEPGGRFLSEYRVIVDKEKSFLGEVVFRFPPPLEDFHRSSDHQFTGYAKVDPAGFNGYIVRDDGTKECMLNSERNRPAFEYAFLADSSMVFWVEESLVDEDLQDGWYGNPDGCTGKQRFAAKLAYYQPVRNEGLIFGDERDGDTVTLRYTKINGGQWPATGPVRVQDRVDLPMTILRPDQDWVVFQISTGPEEGRGVYVFGPIPFGTP
jgi:hypothetical protein